MIRSWMSPSMRKVLSLTPGVTGHDRFFDTFAHFGGDATNPLTHTGEWLDEAVARALRRTNSTLELTYTPNFSYTAGIAKRDWPERGLCRTPDEFAGSRAPQRYSCCLC